MKQWVSTEKCLETRAIFTINRIAFAPAQKLYRIGLLFTYENGDHGASSVLLSTLEIGAAHNNQQTDLLQDRSLTREW